MDRLPLTRNHAFQKCFIVTGELGRTKKRLVLYTRQTPYIFYAAAAPRQKRPRLTRKKDRPLPRNSRLSGPGQRASEKRRCPPGAVCRTANKNSVAEKPRQNVLSKTQRLGHTWSPANMILQSPNCTWVTTMRLLIKIRRSTMRHRIRKDQRRFYLVDRHILLQTTVTSFTLRPAEYPEP